MCLCACFVILPVDRGVLGNAIGDFDFYVVAFVDGDGRARVLAVHRQKRLRVAQSSHLFPLHLRHIYIWKSRGFLS